MTGAALTVVRSEDELFPVFVSPDVATLAVLVTLGTAPAATLTVNVILLVAVAANGPAFVQVTTWSTAEQLQPVPVPDTNPSPARNVSLTVMVTVVESLTTLVSASEYTPLILILKLPVWLFTITLSLPDALPIFVRSEDELFPVFVSPEVATLAV